MLQLHPALLELRTELERQGSVVVCHRDYICLRLPLVASIRIRLNAGQLYFEPRFGPFSRGLSLVLTPIIAALAVLFTHEVAPGGTIVVAFAGLLTVLYDTQRVILTEGAMTRLQQLWSTRQPPKDVIEASLAPAALPAPAPGTPVAGRAGTAREPIARS